MVVTNLVKIVTDHYNLFCQIYDKVKKRIFFKFSVGLLRDYIFFET